MTIKENIDNNIESRIDDKVDMYSVSKEDVSNTMRDLLDYIGATLHNEDLEYTKGWPVYENSPFGIYVARVEGATGPLTDGSQWLKIAGDGLPYLVSGTDVVVSVVPYQPANYYIAYPIVLAEETGKLIDLRFSGIAATETFQVAYAITIDSTGAPDGASIQIKLDNNGVGMATLSVNGGATQRLCFGSLYQFTKTVDVDDTDGYILTKLCSEGIRTLTANSGIFSPGKYIVSPAQIMEMPAALGIGGEEVVLYLTAAGSVTVNTVVGDSIVNVGGYSYNRPIMRFTSDGVNKWYYTE